MTLPLVLAQTMIDNQTAFALPVLVLLLGLAGALAEARWRVGQTERHADKMEEHVQRLESRLAAAEVQQASHGVVLGELKALLTEVRDQLRRAG